MKFPTRAAKPTTPNNAPTNSARREFLDDLPHKIRNSVRGVDLELINQAITLITEGNATIDGKAPATRAERYIVIASYFDTIKTPLNTLFEGALNVQHNCSVTFKLRDQLHTITFPTNPSDN